MGGFGHWDTRRSLIKKINFVWRIEEKELDYDF